MPLNPRLAELLDAMAAEDLPDAPPVDRAEQQANLKALLDAFACDGIDNQKE